MVKEMAVSEKAISVRGTVRSAVAKDTACKMAPNHLFCPHLANFLAKTNLQNAFLAEGGT